MKCNTLKKQWRTLTEPVKSGCGLARDIKPQWFSILDLTSNDANSGLDNTVSNPNGTVFVKENYPDSDVGGEFFYSNNEEQFGDKNSNLIAEKNSGKKLVVKPHQKRGILGSQTQAMSQLAAGWSQLGLNPILKGKSCRRNL